MAKLTGCEQIGRHVNGTAATDDCGACDCGDIIGFCWPDGEVRCVAHSNPVQASAIATPLYSRGRFELRRLLKQRSGKMWSVKGGRGTVWGWITISSPPARCATNEFGYMPDEDREELKRLLGLESVHQQGVSIAASHAYYREYLQRAAGQMPTEIAQPYWD